jgi:hypothetical protein
MTSPDRMDVRGVFRASLRQRRFWYLALVLFAIGAGASLVVHGTAGEAIRLACVMMFVVTGAKMLSRR